MRIQDADQGTRTASESSITEDEVGAWPWAIFLMTPNGGNNSSARRHPSFKADFYDQAGAFWVIQGKKKNCRNFVAKFITSKLDLNHFRI